MLLRQSDLCVGDVVDIPRDRLEFLRYNYKIDSDAFQSRNGFSFDATRIIDGKKVVIKISQIEATRRQGGTEWPLEIAVHQRLRGSSINIELLDFHIFEDYYILILEFPKHNIGFKLFTKIIDSMSEVEVCYFQNLIIGIIAALKERGLQVRGLDVEDFSFDLHTANLKMWDFSNVRFEDDDFTYVGNPAYYPPEILENEQFNYDSFISWTLGLIFYIQLSKGKSEDMLMEIINGKFMSNEKLTKKSAEYIADCLTIDPENRIDINDHLHNEWINNNALYFSSVTPEEEKAYNLCETGNVVCSFCQILEKFYKSNSI